MKSKADEVDVNAAPESTLTLSQFKTFGPVFYEDGGERYRIVATVRYDDRCKYGHNTFSVKGSIDRKSKNKGWEKSSGGCIHEDIARHFPTLARFIKWHLCSSDGGPWGYIGNTLFFAGDRDCNGLRKGEVRQLRRGGTGPLSWELTTPCGKYAGVEGVPHYVDSETRPESPIAGLVYSPWCRIGEGKARELDLARESAVWPEATDVELCADPELLKAALLARLPGLLAEFRRDIESLGFTW